MIKTPLSTVIGGAFWTPGATIIGSSSKNLTQLIKSLFANNEQGFAYDPNDLTTLYQDAAGTIPVTAAGQPVGLMLDKSKGLGSGSNLARNGDFSDGATSWVARANTQLSIVNGRLRVSAVASGISYGVESTLVSATVASKMYRFSAEVYRTNTSNNVYAKGASNTALIRNTSFNIIELGGSSSLAFVAAALGVVAGEYFEIDNVSIKELAGNHAYQSVSASRPILQQTPILGNELLVNGDASNGTDGWITTNTTLNITDGAFDMTASSQYGGVTKNISLDTTKTYEFTFTVTGNTTNAPLTALIRPGSTTINYAQVSITTAGIYKFIFKPTAVTSRLMFQHGNATPIGSLTFDNVSIKEITGYRTDQKYLAFDGVDDELTTTLPAQLTGCTVIRSVPNVGAQILTNQTVPTPYNDNVDNCGLIVINRALTASETSQITKLFNKAAGV